MSVCCNTSFSKNVLPLPLLLPHLSPPSADVIAAQGAETIIAIDVGAEDNNDLTNYGDHISGWYLVWNKLNPFTKTIRVGGAAGEGVFGGL